MNRGALFRYATVALDAISPKSLTMSLQPDYAIKYKSHTDD
ncbi:hypothetical protein [Heliorestis acidaminivorans]|nr:hypothetical protein [Heliorestis acidaminivorans]